jgi:hypothetical protein
MLQSDQVICQFRVKMKRQGSLPVKPSNTVASSLNDDTEAPQKIGRDSLQEQLRKTFDERAITLQNKKKLLLEKLAKIEEELESIEGRYNEKVEKYAYFEETVKPLMQSLPNDMITHILSFLTIDLLEISLDDVVRTVYGVKQDDTHRQIFLIFPTLKNSSYVPIGIQSLKGLWETDFHNNCASVQQLYIQDDHLQSSPFMSFTKLTSLTLDLDVQVNPLIFEHLPMSIKKLKVIPSSEPLMTQNDITPLNRLTNLNVLHIPFNDHGHFPIVPPFVTELGVFFNSDVTQSYSLPPKLKKLYLMGIRDSYHKYMLENVSMCTSLEFLHLDIDHSTDIQKIPHIKSLSVKFDDEMEYIDEQLLQLIEDEQIEDLSIESYAPISHYSASIALYQTKLKKLNLKLDHQQDNYSDLKHFLKMAPQLTSLKVNDVDPAIIEWVLLNSTLKYVEFVNNGFGQNIHSMDTWNDDRVACCVDVNPHLQQASIKRPFK